MVSDGTSQPISEIGMGRMKTKELHDRPKKVLNIFGLGFISASGVCFLFLRKAPS
jgi:hypothetical protein